jgi:uncharacterized protein (DUF58 family)
LRKPPVPAPRWNAAAILALPAIAFGAAVIWPSLRIAGALADAAVLAVLLGDLAAGLLLRGPSIEAPLRMTAPVGHPASVPAKILNSGRRTVRVRVRLDMPDDFADREEEASADAGPNASAEISFRFRPLRRGRWLWKAVRVRTLSPLGFFWMQSEEAIDLECAVLPVLAGLGRASRASRSLAILAAGNRVCARRSGEAELDYLREYRQDDDSRRIDWKASVRVGRPVTKVLRSETSRHVVVALDCGRSMLAEQGGVSSLDYAASALMALAQAAFEAGDSLSAFAFADGPVAELPAVSGRKSMGRVASFLSGLEAVEAESNYEAALERLIRGQRKRSLVVLVTDVSDASYAEPFRRAFALIRRRHLPLLVFLRDTIVQARAEEEPFRGEGSVREYSRVAARQMLADRARTLSYLRASGIMVLDLLPGELTGALTDRYLDLKTRGAL